MTSAAGWLKTDREGDLLVVAAGGAWNVSGVAEFDTRLAGLDAGDARVARIDLGRLEVLDTAAAWVLYRTLINLREAGLEAEFSNAGPAHAALLERIAASDADQTLELPHPGSAATLAEHVGRAAVNAWEEAAALLAFLGQATIAFVRSVRHPGRIRIKSLVSHLEAAGLNAMPIVGLLSFLIGIVVAYQGADQLRRFGAEIFTVNLLALTVLREMGILLAAIIIAGRSGSAFTAEIGTMRVNQEVDAMEALGLDPMDILVMPRVIALVIALPLLAVFADIMGLAGGAVITVTVLDISLVQFLERLHSSVSVSSYWIGIVKAPVFGLAIALVGCREGLNVSGSAESVGRQTTKSVVVSIFLVIVLNAMFSILFAVLKI